jgi:hypothetical protein
MQVLINNKNKKYFDGEAIIWKGSHHVSVIEGNLNSPETKKLIYSEVIISLNQVYKHSKEYSTSIEHIFTQHVSHEIIHKIITENINEETSTLFDNIAGRKARRKYGNLKLSNWFGGFLEV